MTDSFKERFFIAVAVLCTVSPCALRADASADSVMLRRKPAAPVAAAPVAAAPVAAAPMTDKVVPQTVPTADVSVEKAAAPAVPAAPVVEAVKVAESAETPEKVKEGKKKKAEKPVQRDAVITADRTDYDRKEGVVLFDRNVYVDDAQYQMHTDRLFLFLDGTNDLKRLVAIGNVAITNENRRAYCARATFNKKLGRIVMYSSDTIKAQLREEGKKGSEVVGEKITFWIDSEQVEVENPVITMPGGFGGKDSLKKAIGR